MPLPDPASLFLARGEAKFSFSDMVWLLSFFSPSLAISILSSTHSGRAGLRGGVGVVAGKGKGKGGCERIFFSSSPSGSQQP